MKWLWSLLALIALALIIWFGFFNQSKSPTTDNAEARAVAQWLTSSGVKFYGAFWCPHCQDQKAIFGDAADELPYIECSLPDRSAQTDVCIADGITAYPTWEFADGTRYEGVLSIEQLKKMSGYQTPSIGPSP